jgi:hypothetical protein
MARETVLSEPLDPVGSLEAQGHAAQEGLHERREGPLALLNNEVEVIGHDGDRQEPGPRARYGRRDLRQRGGAELWCEQVLTTDRAGRAPSGQ